MLLRLALVEQGWEDKVDENRWPSNGRTIQQAGVWLGTTRVTPLY